MSRASPPHKMGWRNLTRFCTSVSDLNLKNYFQYETSLTSVKIKAYDPIYRFWNFFCYNKIYQVVLKTHLFKLESNYLYVNSHNDGLSPLKITIF